MLINWKKFLRITGGFSMENKNRKETIRTYQKKEIVEVFDKERKKYLYQKYKHKVEANFLKRAISSISSKNIKILDIACGTGRMLPEVFSTGKNIEYIGLDSSKEMFKKLKKKEAFKKNKKNISLVLSDATKIPYKSNYFDIVYSYHLLWHIPKKDQKIIIREMLRVTKKRGIIIFDILNKNFVWERFKKYFGKKKEEGLHKQEISEIKEIIGHINKIEMEKLSDAIIKKDSIYRLFNIINLARSFLPSSLFHMIYFKIRK